MSDAPPGRGQPADILLVEDNPGDVRLTEEAFREARINNELHVVRDGEAALDFLHQRDDYVDSPRPSLVLLDLNLPRVSGMDVLEEAKTDPSLRSIPIVILTSSEAEEDVVESYENHSNAYLTKPIDPDDFVALVRKFEDFWLTLVELPPEPDEP
ncbi:response regulator [Halocalculus aciditolerans]|uniref:Two-component system response regulator n=1 Tax=Halocalculus aciditolerans TaxID=1383812 RepID=A0A830FBH5_9EURY|nr:response regulator [Halocalculus aciditolerans]GGL73230.1 two-component system response regulator [Halocalculus aciditolerans]